jgi:ketosteroid isomerase-like protein
MWIVVPGLLLALLGWRSSATVQEDKAIEAFYRMWMGSSVKGAAAYASHYAADGQILPPNAPPIAGREAIAGWFERAQSESRFVSKPEGINVDEIRFISPTWVVHRSTLRGQRVPKAGGDPFAFETKYFDLLHRSDNGQWEVAYRMWSDNRPQ